jgi:transposase InsO family protein
MFKQYTYEFRKATVLSGVKSKNLKLFLARRNVTERSYFRWLKRYKNEGLKGLYEKSRCPKNIHNQSSDELIPIVLKKSYEGIGQLQISVIISRDPNIPYKISKTGVRNILRRANFLKTKGKAAKIKYKTPYVKNFIKYPGQKGQIDCKYIKELPGESFKRKQYTYVDLFTRYTFRKVYEGVSAENSKDFLNEVIKNAPFKIECIQTDWGIEFTYGMFADVKKPHPFEEELRKKGIKRSKIPVATPRFNGSVESVHSRDQAEFYDKFIFNNAYELTKAIEERNRYWNYDRYHSSLDYVSPINFLKKVMTND